MYPEPFAQSSSLLNPAGGMRRVRLLSIPFGAARLGPDKAARGWRLLAHPAAAPKRDVRAGRRG